MASYADYVEDDEDFEDFEGEEGYCPQCGDELAEGETVICGGCERENVMTHMNIERLIKEGHTEHCAKRITWGDGECECNLKTKEKR